MVIKADMDIKEILSLKSLGRTFSELYDKVQGGRNCAVFSLGEGERMHIASSLDKFVVYVAKDAFKASNVYSRLRDYYGDRVGFLPANEELLINRKSFHKGILAQRITTLYKWAKGEIDCVVTSPQAVVQFLPKKQALLDSVIQLAVGSRIDIYELVDRLGAMGYERQDVVEQKGNFSVAGDIVSIFPTQNDLPIRISFFDDEVESIKEYHPDTMMSIREIESVELMPDNDLLWSADIIEYGLNKAKKVIDKMPSDIMGQAESIYSQLAVSSVCTQQMQWLLPFAEDKMLDIFDYIDNDSIVILDEPGNINDQIDLYQKEHYGRVKQLASTGEVTKEHVKSILSKDRFLAGLDKCQKLGFSYLTSTNALFSPNEIFNIKCVPVNNYTIHYDMLLNDLRAFDKSGYMTMICIGDEVSAESLRKNLIDDNIGCSVVSDFAGKKAGIFILPVEIAKGFIYPECKIAVIGREDISNTRKNINLQKSKAFTMPKVGDFVVHELHGIGKCLGTKYIDMGNIHAEFIVVEYRDGELLYVPIDKLDRLSRYSGSDVEPRLSKIGGKDFGKIKENVKKSIKGMAINLLELYSQRLNKQGYKYSGDDSLQKHFEDAFPHTPTQDQITAINEIKSDMQRGIIMDRLLCGDVGFGKTEVALRAIFKTICHNKQAIILCPTTILARQHYNVAKERFKEYGIDVEPVSRLQTDKQIEASLNRLATGKSLIAVGTHRLLSNDVQFHDLGLIVLDEEHRFGVEHKEKLKVLKKNVNVLTMSATPIPRTLNMAMTGIRDISVLETPPKERLPVQTYVCPLTDSLLIDAITREIARGGQVFILHNRVQTIAEFAKKVSSLVPEAKVDYAHGKMSAETLEDKIGRFYDKKYDVLVSTTIIENGIDIPDANTLIICEANRLGLSQMYQLRGRVGRSNRLAYAYFTTRPDSVITGDSAKRLSAILDYTELGSGFKIAMRDLEIRGAGNILGKEQHGHIEKIGYDLYCKLLKETIDELQGVESQKEIDVKLNLSFSVYIDKNYINDESMRMRLYREILDLDSQDGIDKIKTNIEDSYGKMPQELEYLLDIGLIRNLAGKYGIKQVDINFKNAFLTFENTSCFKNKNIMMAVGEMGNALSLSCEDCPRLMVVSKIASIPQKIDIFKKFLLNCTKSFE